MNIGVIFAGGVGSRMGGDLPKQFIEVDSKPILVWTLEYFEKSKVIDSVVLVMNNDWIEYSKNILQKFPFSKLVDIVGGGDSSGESIYNGLKFCEQKFGGDSIVLLHDGVRPLITEKLLVDIVKSVKKYGTGVTCLPATETVVFSSNGVDVTGVSKRVETFVAGAPQGFILSEIVSAHEAIRKFNPTYTNIVDSCSLYHTLGKPCHLVKGPVGNIKLTRQEDIGTFKAIKAYREDS